MKQAYVFIAIGEKYINEAITIVKSIRLFDFKKRDTVLITEGSYKNEEYFSHVIDIKEQLDIYRKKNPKATTHDLFCVAARIITPQVVKHDEYLMLDTDMLFMWNPEYLWHTFRSQGKCFSCVSGYDGMVWHWGYIDKINKQNKMNMLPMHGGVIYFNRSMKDYDKFVGYLQESLDNYDKIGFKRLFRKKSMTDEPLFSYAMDKTGIIPLKYWEHSIVSFCLPLEDTIPIRTVSWGQKKYPQNYPCIINHFTGLHECPRAKSLYHSWIKRLFSYYISSPNETTGITMLFDIHRESEGDGRKFDDYCKWLEETCKLDIPLVIYCEPKLMGKVATYRKRHPKTIVKPMNLEDVPYYKYLDQCKEIQKHPQYLKKMKMSNRLECKLPLYNLLIMGKTQFMEDIAEENPFDTELFFWVDAGMSRFFEDTDNKTKLDITKPFPKLDNVDRSKINIQVVNDTINGRLKQMQEAHIVLDFRHFTTATLFGGRAENIIKLNEQVKINFGKMINQYKVLNNEQIVMGMVYKRYPEWFNHFLKNKDYYLPILTQLSHRIQL